MSRQRASDGSAPLTSTDIRTDTADLVSLTYTSTATRLMSVAQLVELIEQIRPKNERLGLTGLLLYSGGNVIQTLEGGPEAVDAVFDAIADDPRHGDVRVVDRRAIVERALVPPPGRWASATCRRARSPTCRTSATSSAQSVGHDLGAHAASAFDLLAKFRVSTR